MEELRKLLSQARTEEENRKILEAALFMSSKPLKFSDIEELLDCDKKSTKRMLEEIAFDYEKIDSSIELYQNHEFDEFHLRVSKKYLDKVKHLAVKSEFNQGVQRTLALIAVKQPIEQAMVIKYRNNKAYDHIKELLSKGYIERTPQGRTFILRTTKKFLTYFGDVKSKPLTPKLD